MARKAKATPSRKAKATKKTKIEQPEVVESTLLIPDATLVQSLAKAKLKLQKSNSSAGGEFGKKVGDAVENKHLDRKAFSIACQFNKMFDSDPEKMAITYFHTMRYLKDLDVPNRAAQHQGMFDAEETGPGVTTDDADGDAGNVTHIGQAARRVAERAGDVA